MCPSPALVYPWFSFLSLRLSFLLALIFLLLLVYRLQIFFQLQPCFVFDLHPGGSVGLCKDLDLVLQVPPSRTPLGGIAPWTVHVIFTGRCPSTTWVHDRVTWLFLRVPSVSGIVSLTSTFLVKRRGLVLRSFPAEEIFFVLGKVSLSSWRI